MAAQPRREHPPALWARACIRHAAQTALCLAPKNPHVLILGGDVLAAEAASKLGDLSDGTLTLMSASFHEAGRIAARCGGRAICEGQLIAAIRNADVIFATDWAGAYEMMRQSLADRDKPVVIVDLRFPRRGDFAISKLQGVLWISLENLCDGETIRRVELDHAGRDVAQEADRSVSTNGRQSPRPACNRIESGAGGTSPGEVRRPRKVSNQPPRSYGEEAAA